MKSELWWGFWFAVGMNLAYVFAFAYLIYCYAANKRSHEELTTALAVVASAALSWLIGYLVVGPWWAIITMPALLVGGFLCVRVCAYMREQAARVRCTRREGGR